MFDGATGRALATVDYVPGRDPLDGWGGIGGNAGNDSSGNRCDRFLACVSYLDGERPSLVTCRGVYGRIALVAWDWRDGRLDRRWTFDSGVSHPTFDEASPYSGMGGHSLGVGDVDGDGRDWGGTRRGAAGSRRPLASQGMTRIAKWNWKTGRSDPLFQCEATGVPLGPALLGDIAGDWREEMLLVAPGGGALRLDTTTIPTTHRLMTLLHDPQYRLGLAWQNVVHNKPPHASFYVGDGMPQPPRPAIRLVGDGEAAPGPAGD